MLLPFLLDIHLFPLVIKKSWSHYLTLQVTCHSSHGLEFGIRNLVLNLLHVDRSFLVFLNFNIIIFTGNNLSHPMQLSTCMEHTTTTDGEVDHCQWFEFWPWLTESLHLLQCASC